MTDNQVFWLSMANVWCSVATKETAEYLLKENEHSPPQFRILGMLANNADFARDFQCPAGSKMNPEDKCKLYGDY